MTRILISVFALFITVRLDAGTVGTYTPMTGTVNWASIQIMSELETVANEIAVVVNWTPGTRQTNNVGTNAASRANSMTNLWTYREMQDMIYLQYDDLWFGTNVLEGQTNRYALSALGGGGTYENNFYINDFYIASGLHTNGFRRATTNWPINWTNINDQHYQYGLMQSGDIVGPWIFDDIQRCFDNMNRIVSGGTWDDNTTLFSNRVSELATYTNWTEAVNNLTADWGDSRSYGSLPAARSQATYGQSDFPPYEFNYSLYAERTANKGYITPPGIGVARDIEYYARAVKPTPTVSAPRINVKIFDSNGDDVLEDQWHSWNTVSNFTPTSATHRAYASIYLGNTNLPLPTLVSAPATNEYRQTGYMIQGRIDKFYTDSMIAIEHFEWSYTRE